MEIQAQKRVILYVYMQCIEFFGEKSQVTNVVKYIRSKCSWNFVYRLKILLENSNTEKSIYLRHTHRICENERILSNISGKLVPVF